MTWNRKKNIYTYTYIDFVLGFCKFLNWNQSEFLDRGSSIRELWLCFIYFRCANNAKFLPKSLNLSSLFKFLSRILTKFFSKGIIIMAKKILFDFLKNQRILSNLHFFCFFTPVCISLHWQKKSDEEYAKKQASIHHHCIIMMIL